MHVQLPCATLACFQSSVHVCTGCAGLTQVSIDKQLPFDRLPKPAPGLKTADSNIKSLLALANNTCVPYMADELNTLKGDDR